MQHFNYIIKGRVQGVGFRYFVYNQAKSLGLLGFVKNKVDRTVYVEVEGDLETLKHFETLLQAGPPLSRVDDMLKTTSAIKHFSNFEIR